MGQLSHPYMTTGKTIALTIYLMFNSLENKSSEDTDEQTEALTLQTEEIMI